MKKIIILALCFTLVAVLATKYEPSISVEIEPEFSAPPRISKKKYKSIDQTHVEREPASVQQNFNYPSGNVMPPDYWPPAMEEPYDEPIVESEFPTDEVMVDESAVYVDEPEQPQPEQVEASPDSSVE